MPFQVDDKGKYFTERINKRGLRVTLAVRGMLIQGTLHLAPDYRLKDEMNNPEQFIALTEVKIGNPADTHAPRETDLLIINKQQVDWISPDAPEPAPKDS